MWLVGEDKVFTDKSIAVAYAASVGIEERDVIEVVVDDERSVKIAKRFKEIKAVKVVVENKIVEHNNYFRVESSTTILHGLSMWVYPLFAKVLYPKEPVKTKWGASCTVGYTSDDYKGKAEGRAVGLLSKFIAENNIDL